MNLVNVRLVDIELVPRRISLSAGEMASDVAAGDEYRDDDDDNGRVFNVGLFVVRKTTRKTARFVLYFYNKTRHATANVLLR